MLPPLPVAIPLFALAAIVLYQGWVIRKMRENDKQARWIIQNRQQMLDEALFESEIIRQEAHKREEAS